ncbi:hypothetical protein DAERI_090166 [Deinococcus aerius]|uniref:Uncharacterized protein n=1 Tax=Deinococcus aerius TaxID=200253 RepID=A0A2I9D7U6_9DEIO|nr:hypothetical protein DAERI_090166 [Deinococcus aerius]
MALPLRRKVTSLAAFWAASTRFRMSCTVWALAVEARAIRVSRGRSRFTPGVFHPLS